MLAEYCASLILVAMRRPLIIAVALMLSACASSITGNELGGIVSHDANEQGDAFARADRFCERYNKRARVRQIVVDLNQLAFDCVMP